MATGIEKLIEKQREPISGVLHLIGAVLSIGALVFLVTTAAETGEIKKIYSVTIFGLSLIFAYIASTLYHLIYLAPKEKGIFRQIDQSMIYILIAGTYTPICLIALTGSWGWSLLSIVWSLTIIGVIIKIKNIPTADWLSTTIYLLMGWMILIVFPLLLETVPIVGIAWLVIGGIFYTTGTIFYGLDKVLPKKRKFWMHEIWHLFVMAGSFCHFWLVLKYILPI